MSQSEARHTVAVSELERFYRLVGDLLVRTTRRSRRIQLIIIVLTVLTTGTLWALISTSFETAAAWSGAVATTLLSFLSLYQATIGPGSKLREIQSIYDDAGEYLAHLTSSATFDYEYFADRLRRFESRIRQIETDHEAVFLQPALVLVGPRQRRESLDRRNQHVKEQLLDEVEELKSEVDRKRPTDNPRSQSPGAA